MPAPGPLAPSPQRHPGDVHGCLHCHHFRYGEHADLDGQRRGSRHPADRQVTGGWINGTTSTVTFASSTVASGSTDMVTIVVKDAAGNAVSGLTNSPFSLVSVGTSTGTFSTVTPRLRGTYTATFTGSKAGTASTLTTTVSGIALNKANAQVRSGGQQPESTARFAAATIASGTTDMLTIVVKDDAGNVVSGLTTSAFRFAFDGLSVGTFRTVTATTTDGTYTGTFTGTTAGTASTLTTTITASP